MVNVSILGTLEESCEQTSYPQHCDVTVGRIVSSIFFEEAIQYSTKMENFLRAATKFKVGAVSRYLIIVHGRAKVIANERINVSKNLEV